MNNTPHEYILTAGSIVKIEGLPYELTTDVKVIGGSIPPNFIPEWAKCTSKEFDNDQS